MNRNPQTEFESILNCIPANNTPDATFMEIAGFPHYENVCSNILRFFLTPNHKISSLNNVLFMSLLEVAGINNPATYVYKNVTVKREVTTSNGRIDLLLFSPDWVIAVENKIRHHLNNDLDEYAEFVAKEYKRLISLNIVLSLKKEEGELGGNFINITYAKLIEKIEQKLSVAGLGITYPYYTTFVQFLQTIKNLYMPVTMEKEEIEFLINNEDKIDELLKLKNKLNLFINQRACYIRDNIKQAHYTDKWVYEGYDVGFHFMLNEVRFKLECPIETFGIEIHICVEPNRADWENLRKLKLFKDDKEGKYRENLEKTRIILRENIDFYINDNELIKILEEIIDQVIIEE